MENYDDDFEIFSNVNHINKSPLACLELIKELINKILNLTITCEFHNIILENLKEFYTYKYEDGFLILEEILFDGLKNINFLYKAYSNFSKTTYNKFYPETVTLNVEKTSFEMKLKIDVFEKKRK